MAESQASPLRECRQQQDLIPWQPCLPRGLGLAEPSKVEKLFLQCLDRGAMWMSSLIFSDDRPGDPQWHTNFLRGKKV